MSQNITDVNTTEPFCAGSCRFAELNGDLYVRTCHKMYKSGDGLNHQASAFFRIRMSDLTVLEKQTGVSSIRHGYMSHSFNQFLAEKNGKIYACDHGDAYERAIAIMRFDTGITGKYTAVGRALEFYGKIGNNYTGATLGGFAVSDTHCISIGNSVRQTRDGVKKSVRNIYVSAMEDTDINVDAMTRREKIDAMRQGLTLANGVVDFAWITNYSSNGKRTAGDSKLVPIDKGRYLLLWEEERNGEVCEYECTHYVFLDGSGKKTSEIKTIYAPLSDCQPIVSGNYVVWYVTTGMETIFYKLPVDGSKISLPKKNEKFTKDGIIYQVTKSGTSKGEVKVIGYDRKRLGAAVLLNKVTYQNCKFAVTEIGKNAFRNCRKLNDVEIGRG